MHRDPAAGDASGEAISIEPQEIESVKAPVVRAYLAVIPG